MDIHNHRMHAENQGCKSSGVSWPVVKNRRLQNTVSRDNLSVTRMTDYMSACSPIWYVGA